MIKIFTIITIFFTTHYVSKKIGIHKKETIKISGVEKVDKKNKYRINLKKEKKDSSMIIFFNDLEDPMQEDAKFK
jgi:hypothetical protein